MKSNTSQSGITGEGDPASAKKYNSKLRTLDDLSKVEEAANDSAPRNEYEDAAMRMAEAKARALAKAMRGRMEICLDGTSRPVHVTVTRTPPRKWMKPDSVPTPKH